MEVTPPPRDSETVFRSWKGGASRDSDHEGEGVTSMDVQLESLPPLGLQGTCTHSYNEERVATHPFIYVYTVNGEKSTHSSKLQFSFTYLCIL